MTIFAGAAVCMAAYLFGAIPFAQIAARVTKGVDLRRVGSGTVSGTALFDLAGFLPLAAVGLLEIAKGAVGPLIADPGTDPTLAAIAAGLAVVGHDWSVFLGGAGGRGISPAIGALAIVAWPGSVVLLAALAIGRLMRATGFVCFIATIALVPVLAALYGGQGLMVSVAVAVPILVKRVFGNEPPPRSSLRVLLNRLLYDDDVRGAT